MLVIIVSKCILNKDCCQDQFKEKQTIIKKCICHGNKVMNISAVLKGY